MLVRVSHALPAAVLALSVLAPPDVYSRPASTGALPPLMLWAWERTEDLTSVPHGVGVAFLAQTLDVTATELTVRPRQHPLRVSAGTPLAAVTRIETPGPLGPDVSAGLTARIAAAIAKTAAMPRVTAVQIDFDAVRSERAFYRRVLQALRDATSGKLHVSMTALASWCMDDRWLEDLPVDERVPMLFRMGPFEEQRLRKAAAGSLQEPSCRSAIGIALDEPVSFEPRGRRVYVFNPRAWTAADVVAAERLAGR